MPTGKAKPSKPPSAFLTRDGLTRRLVLLYSRRHLPATSYLLRYGGVFWQPHWRGAPTLTARERHTGALLRLDTSDVFERIAYFRGCYHELDILATLRACLRPGDVLLDGGANIGLLALYAAGLVGERGEVIAVEPGPRALEALRWHVEQNGLRSIRVVPFGLSDEAAACEFKQPDPNNIGSGTLGPPAPRLSVGVRDFATVQVRRGDDLLDPADQRPLFVKLDVEGFELRALHGLERTLAHRRPAVLCEVNAETLSLNGATKRDIADLLGAAGYRMFGLHRHNALRAHALELPQISVDDLARQRDVLFLHPESIHWGRAARRLRDARA